MEVVGPHRRIPAAARVVQTLPLYRSAPELEVRLEDFELFAIYRLRGDSFSQSFFPFLTGFSICTFMESFMRMLEEFSSLSRDLGLYFPGENFLDVITLACIWIKDLG